MRTFGYALTITFILILFLHSAVPVPAADTRATLDAPCKRIHPSDSLIKWKCAKVKKKETLEGLFGPSWEDVVRFNRIDRRHVYPGISLKVPEDLSLIEGFTPLPERFEPAAGEPKFILLDLEEEWLGAYEYGELVFSVPAAIGEKGNETPRGGFRITAFHREHASSKYTIEGTETPYPMHYGLRFWIHPKGFAYWIHGRDVPGHPASHGCIGLYDEEMQKEFYGYPNEPVLMDAKMLYEWVLGDTPDDGQYRPLKAGPRLLVVEGALNGEELEGPEEK